MKLAQNYKLKTFNKKDISNKKSVTYTIAIAGNPNVGKSTVFNALTGLHQHTGNWPGKTVECATGKCCFANTVFNVVDLPGTYSLMSNSPEEEIARDYVCFNNPDVVIIVMDATCIEKNLNLAIQILEITNKAIICLNLIDEAAKKQIKIDIDELSMQLGVPVICTNARSKKGIQKLIQSVKSVCNGETKTFSINNNYCDEITNAVNKLCEKPLKKLPKKINKKWIALKILENDEDIIKSIQTHLKIKINKNKKINSETSKTNKIISKKYGEAINDMIIKSIISRSEKISRLCVKHEILNYDKSERTLDKILTSKSVGIPIMILFLALIFWLTIVGANYPSELIAGVLFKTQDILSAWLSAINAPAWINGLFVMGIYRTLAWVVSVMLPPMAIFFPLFTFLEDVGYLPRIAFNTDNIFKKCGAHGKQALTMCMGFGCNACGVVGCKIIDSPRERLIAILTNNFVPCNGRFPLLITIMSMFFVGELSFFKTSILSSIGLTLIILCGIFATFAVSKLLSTTILKGIPSSFVLELPPYRKPQIGKILIRSILDRTIFVLGRAVAVAAPAGMIIWLTANIHINNISVLKYCTNFLDPFAKLIGLDGVILTAFILGFPANEIVLPIIIMSYMCTGSIMEIENLASLHNLLVANGWTHITAVCTVLFSLMHFPCGTTCLTIKKETGSTKWTIVAFLLPTLIGLASCFVVSNLLKIATGIL